MSTPTSEHRSWSLGALTPHAQAIAVDLWAEGYAAGIAEGRRQVEDAEATAWAQMRETIHAAARTPDIAVLQERRGQHDRAARTRQLWAERGLS